MVVGMISCVFIGFMTPQLDTQLLTRSVGWYVEMFDLLLLFILAITDLACVVNKCLK